MKAEITLAKHSGQIKNEILLYLQLVLFQLPLCASLSLQNSPS